MRAFAILLALLCAPCFGEGLSLTVVGPATSTPGSIVFFTATAKNTNPPGPTLVISAECDYWMEGEKHTETTSTTVTVTIPVTLSQWRIDLGTGFDPSSVIVSENGKLIIMTFIDGMLTVNSELELLGGQQAVLEVRTKLK